MNSRDSIRRLFALGLSILAQFTAGGAVALAAAEKQFPVAEIPGLELIRGKTVDLPNKGSPPV
jgi:hypothetical protein